MELGNGWIYRVNGKRSGPGSGSALVLLEKIKSQIVD